LIEEKKKLHSDMDFYKDNYPEELRAFYLEDKYKNEIISIQWEKQRTSEWIKLFDDKRKKTRE